jgi:hypothetical protein
MKSNSHAASLNIRERLNGSSLAMANKDRGFVNFLESPTLWFAISF